MPMLQRTPVSWLRNWIGSDSSATSLRATTSASPGSERWASSTPNSSPPRRAALSDLRRHALIRRARLRSSPSPTAWPSESLIDLKPSRSMNSTARHSSARLRREHRLGELVVELRAVGEPGERVVGGEMSRALARAVELQDHPVILERGRDRGDEAARRELALHREAARAALERAQRDLSRRPRPRAPRAAAEGAASRARATGASPGRSDAADAQQEHVEARRVGLREEVLELRRVASARSASPPSARAGRARAPRPRRARRRAARARLRRAVSRDHRTGRSRRPLRAHGAAPEHRPLGVRS